MSKNRVTVDMVQISNKKDEVLTKLSLKTDGLNFLIDAKNELLGLSDSFISLANRETSKPNFFLIYQIQKLNNCLFFKENSNQIIELSDSFFLQNKEHVNSQFILVDATIASRNDAVLNFKFNFENLKDSVEVNIIDPTGKKHELKSMDKCLFSSHKSLLVIKI